MIQCISFVMTLLSCVDIILSRNLKSPELSDITRVVGGGDCNNDYPFMVSLQIMHKGELKHFCGGSLVQQQWVLTAAHCCDFDDRIIVAVIGYKNITQAEGIPCDYSVTHPRYHSLGAHHDIAMVHLLVPVNTTEFVNLPSKDFKNDIRKVCKTCLIMGFGVTSQSDKDTPKILQCAQMSAVSIHTCKQMFGTIRGLFINFRGIICVFGGRQSACFGDSGGPMLCGNVQYGIASFVADCSGNFPSAYTSVGNHLDFIYHTLNKGNSVSLNLMLFYIALVVLMLNY